MKILLLAVTFFNFTLKDLKVNPKEMHSLTEVTQENIFIRKLELNVQPCSILGLPV